ncbi:hypothetical protein [Streptomyces sp. NPDC050504]|uniref:hypothetical protein n=1 Tax=Streptomyces sp. NPDC050504 TaxID=3365618 RepID=UPI0037979B4F
MSQEAVPDQAVPEQRDGAPKGLLQQMEELMAALNADLSQLDADLQSSVDRGPADRTAPEAAAPGSGAHTTTAPADTTASTDRPDGEPGR